MEPKEAIERLKGDVEFTVWRDAHPEHILAHIFLQPDNVQVGYFDPTRNLMTTFVLGDQIKVVPDQEILRGDGVIDELDLSQVSKTREEAEAIAEALRKEDYAKEHTIKSLTILQNLEGTCVYNITYFTASFKTINVKVNALDGSIVHHSLASLVDFDKKPGQGQGPQGQTPAGQPRAGQAPPGEDQGADHTH